MECSSQIRYYTGKWTEEHALSERAGRPFRLENLEFMNNIQLKVGLFLSLLSEEEDDLIKCKSNAKLVSDEQCNIVCTLVVGTEEIFLKVIVMND